MHGAVASAMRTAYSVVPETFRNDMTETNTSASPRLWTPQGFREDEWRRIAADEPVSGGGKLILPLTAYLALDPQTALAGAERFGVLLSAGEPVDRIADRLEAIPLVALDFPAFSDGRSFSKADLLRTRHGYKGAIRAVGDVLIDQIPHMLRTGFSEFEVTNRTALERLEAGDLRGLPLYYQPSAEPALATNSYSWRRRPAE